MPRCRLAAIAAVTAALTGCAAGATPLSDADLAAIAEVRESYRQAILAADEAAIAASYTPDAVEMPPHAPLAQGHDAIRTANQALVQVADFQLTSVEVMGYGDLAYDRGTFAFSGTVQGMRDAVTDQGKYVAIVRRQADGSWLLARTIWNSDLPLPLPPDSAGAMAM